MNTFGVVPSPDETVDAFDTTVRSSIISLGSRELAGSSDLTILGWQRVKSFPVAHVPPARRWIDRAHR
jgi:hypothetical protein